MLALGFWSIQPAPPKVQCPVLTLGLGGHPAPLGAVTCLGHPAGWQLSWHQLSTPGFLFPIKGFRSLLMAVFLQTGKGPGDVILSIMLCAVAPSKHPRE